MPTDYSIGAPNDSIDPKHLLIPSKIVAIVARDAMVHPYLIESLATQTQNGERVGVLIGNNRLALHSLMRLAQQRRFEPALLLNRMELSRAFTCYQLHRRIQTIDLENTRRWHALYVLGLLDTFYDESVKSHEAARLLNTALTHLQRIAQMGLPVLITLAAPQKSGRESFIKLVENKVDEYWELVPPAKPMPIQLEFLSHL